MDYEKMYAILCGAMFNAIDALETVPEAEQAILLMRRALNQMEEMYITGR